MVCFDVEMMQKNGKVRRGEEEKKNWGEERNEGKAVI